MENIALNLQNSLSTSGLVVAGVSIGDPLNKLTWLVTLNPPATSRQQSQITAIISLFNSATIPQSVTSMQAKVALLRAGMLDAVQAWINTQSAETQLVWNSTSTFARDSQLLTNAAADLGVTSAQIDDLFTTAATISP